MLGSYWLACIVEVCWWTEVEIHANNYNVTTQASQHIISFMLKCTSCLCSWYNASTQTVTSWVKKLGGGVEEVAIFFRQRAANFRQSKIMGAQNFNLVPKFTKNGGFPTPTFVFLEENLQTRIKFSNRLKFRGGAIALLPSPATTPMDTKLQQIIGNTNVEACWFNQYSSLSLKTKTQNMKLN